MQTRGDPRLFTWAALGSATSRVLPGRGSLEVHPSMSQPNLCFALWMFPSSCSCGSGTIGLCVSVNACACLSGLLWQCNHNSLHKACLSHMTLNIHGPASCTNSSVSFKTARKGLQFTPDLSTEDECGL